MDNAENTQDSVGKSLTEWRRFRRIRLSKSGRVYIPAIDVEAACSLEDISAGGARIRCELTQEPHGKAIVYLGDLGRLEGPIITATKDEFTMAFTCSRGKRDKLADQLTVELNRHILDDSALRLNDSDGFKVAPAAPRPPGAS
jgi:hypothetical protein